MIVRVTSSPVSFHFNMQNKICLIRLNVRPFKKQ